MIKHKIYYFPYAGASSSTFKRWNNLFDHEVEFIAFDYAGHGDKSDEPFSESIEEMCEELYELILEDNEEEVPYVLAGHCLGGILACELYYMIVERGEMPIPDRIFISGHGAPDKVVDEGLLGMEDEQLLCYFNQQGIIPDSMLEGEVRRFTEGLYLPPIKADANIYLNYQWNSEREKIEVPLTIQYGIKDKKCPLEEIQRWTDFTTKEVHFISYDAGHYFIMEQAKQLVEDIQKDMNL